MGMTPDHFFMGPFHGVAQGEAALGLRRRRAGQQHKEAVPKLLLRVGVVPAVQRLQILGQLLPGEFGEIHRVLLPVPGAALRRAQKAHQRRQRAKPVVFRFGRG